MKDDEKGGPSISEGLEVSSEFLNSVTPWSRVLQKLTVSHLVKKFPAFY